MWRPRKHGYKNHPCTIWVRQTPSNLEWLVYHALEMNQERYYRWANSKAHFSIEFIEWCADNIDSALFEQKEKGLTKFPIAISEDKKCREIDGFDDLDRVEQYRLYYIHDKPFADWTFRLQPSWYWQRCRHRVDWGCQKEKHLNIMKLKAAKRYNSYTQERLESAETKGSAIILEDSDDSQQ